MIGINALYRFKSCGEHVTIFPYAHLVGQEHIALGYRVMIDSFTFIAATAECPVKIGEWTHIASFVSITGGPVVLEDFATLASGVRIVAGSDDFLGDALVGSAIPAKYRKVKRTGVHLGRHSIVGANSVVLPGVTIGEGAAVGANSLVTRDIPSWEIWAGSPARFLKVRPREKVLHLEADLRAEVP